jgi:hypothetical protein
MKRAVCHLSRRERSDRIVRCDPGEGFRCIDRPFPLTRRCAPTSPHGRGEPRRTFLATSKINALTHCFFLGANGSRECAPDDRLRDAAIHFLRFLDCFASLAMTEKASGDLLQAAAGRFKGRTSKGGADDDSTYARTAAAHQPVPDWINWLADILRDPAAQCVRAVDEMFRPPWRAWGMPDARCTRGLVCTW